MSASDAPDSNVGMVLAVLQRQMDAMQLELQAVNHGFEAMQRGLEAAFSLPRTTVRKQLADVRKQLADKQAEVDRLNAQVARASSQPEQDLGQLFIQATDALRLDDDDRAKLVNLNEEAETVDDLELMRSEDFRAIGIHIENKKQALQFRTKLRDLRLTDAAIETIFTKAQSLIKWRALHLDDSALEQIGVKAGARSKLQKLRFDFRGADLSKLDLSGLNLSALDLSEANLSETNLSGADLSMTNLVKADLSNANLSNVNLSQADLSNAKVDLSGLDLSGQDLSGINLSKINLSGTNFSGADLSKTSLRDADLSNANLSKYLQGVDLRDAVLCNAKIEQTPVESVMETFGPEAFPEGWRQGTDEFETGQVGVFFGFRGIGFFGVAGTITVEFGSDGDNDCLFGLMCEENMEHARMNPHICPSEFGPTWSVQRGREGAQGSGKGSIVADHVWELSGVATMAYNGLARSVQFWDGPMEGEPTTTIDNLPLTCSHGAVHWAAQSQCQSGPQSAGVAGKGQVCVQIDSTTLSDIIALLYSQCCLVQNTVLKQRSAPRAGCA